MPDTAQTTPEAPSFESVVAEAAAKIGYKEPASEPMTAEEESIPAEVHGEPAPVAAAPAPEPVPPPPQTVPLAVHIRQREKYEREQAELRRALDVGNQRLAQIAQQIAPPQPPVDRATDPLGAALSELDAVKQDVNQTRQMLEKQAKDADLQQQVNQFKTAVAQDEQDYATQVPDLGDAIQYAKDVKFREYVALGLDAQQASLRVQQDAFALAQHAFQNGYRPSELAYRMAHALGYQKRETSAVQVGEGGSLDEPVIAPTSAETAVEMRAAGAMRGKASGGAPSSSGPISMQELAKLDNEEFAKMTSGKKWERLFR